MANKEKNGKKIITWKDIVEVCGILSAIVLSTVGVIQSNRAIKISQSSLDFEKQSQNIELAINGHADNNPLVTLVETNSSEPINECAFGIILFDYQVQVDNISNRKVSIRKISVTPLFNGNMFSIYTSTGSTDFQGQWELITAEGLSPTRLPLSIDEGGSIDLVTKLGWPLEKISFDAVAELLNENPQKEIRLADVMIILAKKGRSLGCSAAQIDFVSDDNWIYSQSESDNIQLEIDVTTSLNTHHTAILDLER